MVHKQQVDMSCLFFLISNYIFLFYFSYFLDTDPVFEMSQKEAKRGVCSRQSVMSVSGVSHMISALSK